jgi:ADP-ribosylglycohydrolase/fructose-1,6-bisphosphatase/inositol monophosphatase family enzyme
VPTDYRAALHAAVDAAHQAGDLLRAEFNRPDGPRGASGTCPADNEAELLIRRLLEAFDPTFGIIAEEFPQLNRRPADAASHVWLVDPNDGTSRMQQGYRGAAVSIGLVRNGTPVLGVVYAYAARAGRGDLITWAEGLDLERNGRPVRRPPWAAVRPRQPASPDSSVSSSDTVLISPAADRAPAGNARTCAPARFRTIASPAYRLALVAIGEGVAASCLGGPDDYDVAAGHALLRAVGGELFRVGGDPVRYGSDGHADVGDFVAGHPEFARELALRTWPATSSGGRTWLVVPPPDLTPGLGLTAPDATVTVTDPGLLERAQGVLTGQLVGDALGSLVEFRRPDEIEAQYGETGPTSLADGGTFGTLAGQPTDDSEMALALARTILAEGRYDAEATARAYVAWARSGPFDIGGTTAHALHAALAEAGSDAVSDAGSGARPGHGIAEAARRAAAEYAHSQANGAVMRISPLALFAHRLPDHQIAELARSDASLTHAHPVCGDANALYCVTVAAAVREGLSARATYDYAVAWARTADLEPDVVKAIEDSETGPPEDFMRHQGWVLLGLRNAFHQLLTAADPREGVVDTVRRGGDTDTNAAIAGALLGAVHGVAGFPTQWLDRLATCRALQSPEDGLWHTGHPRPEGYWPVDHLVLAEHLAFRAPTSHGL